ncbi:MAG: hypothetical protein IKU70_05080 [Clostridia bacterium]|nr:hypothetical protein [Clostridia bacterium]
MKNFVFGMDTNHPADSARMIRERGYDAVVLGGASTEVAGALDAEGIELYLCFGAYGVPKDSARLAEDAFHMPRRWFNSGCPNDLENAEKHLNAILEKAAQLPTVRGILVDGARFASFASVEGIEPFFTCFCPRCMQAMQDMGLDAESIRETVGRLMQKRSPQPGDEVLLRQWLSFREKTVQDYMDRFAAKVHNLRSGLIAGAFIFAPSLGLFVGQTPVACRSLDVVSHMLYRDYHQQYGVACLGHEWAALVEGFGKDTQAFLNACGADPAFSVTKTPDELLHGGFEPEWVGLEVAKARENCPTQQLWPILQLDDDRVHKTAQCSRQSGADAVGLFAYSHGELPVF